MIWGRVTVIEFFDLCMKASSSQALLCVVGAAGLMHAQPQARIFCIIASVSKIAMRGLQIVCEH